jgi:hypothetical protein
MSRDSPRLWPWSASERRAKEIPKSQAGAARTKAQDREPRNTGNTRQRLPIVSVFRVFRVFRGSKIAAILRAI